MVFRNTSFIKKKKKRVVWDIKVLREQSNGTFESGMKVREDCRLQLKFFYIKLKMIKSELRKEKSVRKATCKQFYDLVDVKLVTINIPNEILSERITFTAFC